MCCHEFDKLKAISWSMNRWCDMNEQLENSRNLDDFFISKGRRQFLPEATIADIKKSCTLCTVTKKGWVTCLWCAHPWLIAQNNTCSSTDWLYKITTSLCALNFKIFRYLGFFYYNNFCFNTTKQEFHWNYCCKGWSVCI